MVSAGWVVKSSGDGTTYNSTGDQISSAASLAVTRAWFRIQDPGTRREFTFQRGTDNTLWRVKFSESSKFTGGTPNATTTPTATDEALLFGSALGTDSTATGTQMFNTDATYRSHAICFSDVVSTNVYDVYFFTTDFTTGLTRTYFFVSGVHSSNAQDTSPLFIVAAYKTAILTSTDVHNVTITLNIIRAWYKYGLSGAAFNVYRMFGLTRTATGSSAATSVPPYSVSVSPNGYAGDEDVAKICGAFRDSTDTSQHYKGISQRMALNMNSARTYPDTLNLTTDAYVWVNTTFVIPWENSTAAIL